MVPTPPRRLFLEGLRHPGTTARDVATRRASAEPTRPHASLEQRFTFETIVERRGPTTMCSVVDKRTRQPLTLTTYELSGTAEWEGWDRFVHGCIVLRSLRHGGVPSYVEHGEHGSVAYLLTSRVPGRSLRHRIASGERFSDLKLWHILRKGLGVLRYLHELNPPVFHGGLEPSTVFVSERGELMLVGFDRAASMLSTYDPLAAISLDGSPAEGFAAPELRRQPPRAASDVFAFAATLLALATGQQPATLPRTGDTYDPASCMRPSELCDALAALLHVDPELRHAAARRLERAR
ncbi:MAG: hypothetical protein AB1Z98_30880 [Nannocystaceae bacterium]